MASAHEVFSIVLHRFSGANIQGGFFKIRIRSCHTFSCSDTLRPPRTAFSLITRMVAKACIHVNISSDWHIWMILSLFGKALA